MSFKTETDSLRIKIKHDFNNNKLISFFEAGLTFDYRTKRNLIFSYGAFYTFGNEILSVSDFSYTHNEIINKTGKIISKGNNIRWGFGLKLPVSNIWNNKNLRVENKPQKMDNIKNLAEKKFYISVGLGLINFNIKPFNDSLMQNDPERTPLSFDKSSSTKGIFLGYKLTENLIIETGFQSQTFNHRYFFIINDTLAQGGQSWWKKTNFYVSPLNLKYQFYSKNKRLSIVPKIGISPTFSFISGYYDAKPFDLSVTINGDTLESDFALDAYRLKKFSIGVNCGIGFEYAISSRLIFTMDATYSYGFSKLHTTVVKYSDADKTINGNLNYYGINKSVIFGFKVPFNLRKQ